MRIAANIISYLIHPSIMPSLGLFVILQAYRYTFPDVLYQRILLLVVTGTYLLPLITTIILLKLGYLSSLKLKRPEDRKMPFLLSAVYFYFSAQLLKSLDAVPLLYIYLMGATVSVFSLLVMLKQMRVSAHTAGISGFVTLLVLLQSSTNIISTHQVAMSFLVLGLVGWARLKLNAHSLKEVLLGYLFGAAPVILLYLIV